MIIYFKILYIPINTVTFQKSVEQEVSVATLIDYYDPDFTMGGHNYPGMHDLYGNVFASDSEEEIKKASGKGCYATFCNENGNKKDFFEIWSTIKQCRK